MMKLLIQILIFFSFLSPFITCNTGVVSTAVENVFDSTTNHGTTITGDSLLNIKDNHKQSVDTTFRLDKDSNEPLWKKVCSKILFPADNSISGFGSIFYFGNITGEIAVGISFALSLFLIFPWRFLKMKNRRIYLRAITLLCMTLFILTVLIDKYTDLLWGSWLVTSLIVIDLFLESKSSANKNIESNGA